MSGASYRVISINPPCLVLCTDSNRYVFGMSEGTQRLCVEHKVRLIKLSAVCITDISHPNSFMGLPGLLLTLKDLNCKNLSIFGPKGISDIYGIIFNFLNRYTVGTISLYDASITNQPIQFEDISILPIQIGTSSTCYLNITNQIAGKFNLDKAIALGVPRGPLYAELKKGLSVTLSDGRVISSEEVVDAPELGSHSLVVCAIDPNDESALLALINSPHLLPYISNPSSNETNPRLHIVIHLSSRTTIYLPAYTNWMISLGLNTHHIFLPRDHSPAHNAHIAANEFNQKLHTVCPEICPIITLSPSSLSINIEGLNIIQADNLTYTIAPLKKIGPAYSEMETSDFADFTNRLSSLEYASATSKANSISSNECIDQSHQACILTSSLGSIRFLGTGAAIPCKYRSVSGILLNINTQSSILLDCGEGSWSQLMTMSNHDEIISIASSLRVVWISHPHADHHLGLLRILFERKQLLISAGLPITKVVIIAPSAVIQMIQEYTNIQPLLIDSYVLILCSAFDDTRKRPLHSKYQSLDDDMNVALDVFSSMGIKQLKCCSAKHCAESYCVSIETIDGVKIVYSGDTRPCDNIVKLGMDATILIHEATFGDEHITEAKEKNHSTVSEAMSIGQSINAYRVILTHYSQRYRSFPPIHCDYMDKVILAFDFMHILLCDIIWAPLITSKLLIAFPSEEVDGNELLLTELPGEKQEDKAKARIRSEVGGFARRRSCI